MRKVSMFFIVAVFAFSITAVTAWGSQLDIAEKGKLEIDGDGDPTGPPGGAVTVAEEILTVDREVDLEKEVSPPAYPRLYKRDILYSPTIDIKEDSTIEITVTNGAIKSTTGNVMYMLLEDDKGDGAQAGVMTDYTFNTAGTGYDFMRFQFTKVDRNGSGDTGAPGEDTIKSGEVLSFSTVLDGTQGGELSDGLYDDHSPTLIINKGLTKGKMVSIEVTGAKDNNGNLQDAPKTIPENIARVVEGIVTTLIPATSTIDAQQSRLVFVEEGAANDAVYEATGDTDLKISTARDLHVDEEVAEVGFKLNSADKYTLSLTRVDATGVSSVEWSGQPGSHTSGTTTWTKTGNFGDSVGGTMLNGAGMEAGYLQAGKWELTLKIDTDEVVALDDQIELDGYYSHDWDINAMQVKIPYIALNSPGYLSFIKIANESDTEAELQGEAIIWNITDNRENPENTSTWEGDIKTVPALSISTLTEAELMAVFGLSDTKVYHVELTLSVVAPINKVHVAAFQKDPNGRTDLPVLYDVQNGTGRQWQ